MDKFKIEIVFWKREENRRQQGEKGRKERRTDIQTQFLILPWSSFKVSHYDHF